MEMFVLYLRKLDDIEYDKKAEAFSDKDVFNDEVVVDDDVLGYQIAVGILGAIICLEILCVLIFACWFISSFR